MDAINHDLTQCLIKADQKCCKFSDNPWSPMLHCTYMEHHFWTIQLMVYQREWPHTQALQNLQANLNLETTTLLPDEMVSIHLQKTQHRLQAIHKEAETKCCKFLNTLLQAAKHTKNDQHKKLILGLKHAKENC